MDGSLINYVKAHPSLQKACGVSDRVILGNTAYVKLLRLYKSAVHKLLSTDSAVAEAKECAVAKRADDDHFSKFKNHTPRIGRQYFTSTLIFKRDSQRRRSHGGGRHRSCGVLREMLAMWYNIVRHSVDVKIMCRFPKKVILVKAVMLQQDY